MSVYSLIVIMLSWWDNNQIIDYEIDDGKESKIANSFALGTNISSLTAQYGHELLQSNILINNFELFTLDDVIYTYALITNPVGKDDRP